MTENPFGISKLELLELAASKLVDQFSDEESLSDMVRNRIHTRIETIVATEVKGKIDALLTEQMTALMKKEICPVDMFGESTGTPTTIQATMAERAKVFWNEKVTEEGKPSSGWGGESRHVHIYRKIATAAFAEAIKQDTVNIVGALKDAIRTDMQASLSKHLNELIRVNTKGD